MTTLLMSITVVAGLKKKAIGPSAMDVLVIYVVLPRAFWPNLFLPSKLLHLLVFCQKACQAPAQLLISSGESSVLNAHVGQRWHVLLT